MDLLKSFLKKFEGLKDPKEDRENISKALSTLLGVEVSPDYLYIKDKTVFFSGKSALKNEIYLRRDEVVNKINETLLPAEKSSEASKKPWDINFN